MSDFDDEKARASDPDSVASALLETESLRVPTELMDWEMGRWLYGVDDAEADELSEAERRENMVSVTWEDLTDQLETEGYGSLQAMASRLKSHRSKLRESVSGLGSKLTGYRQLRKLMQDLAREHDGETSLKEPIRPEVDLPSDFEKTWMGYDGDPGYVKVFYNARDGTASLTLPEETTLDEASDLAKDKALEVKKQHVVSSRMRKHVKFRLEIARRLLLWREIFGTVASPSPRDIIGNPVPDVVRSHDTPLRQARTVLEFLPLLTGEEGEPRDGTFPESMEALASRLSEEFSAEDLRVSPTSFVQGAARLFREHLDEENYEEFHPHFYQLLREYELRLRKWSSKLDQDIPQVGNGS